MKFLCPQCKAKYRIADEKLAQRNSSRMKCRKCGHVIDIHAASVPESIHPPGTAPRHDPDENGDDDEGRLSSLPRVSPAPPAPAPAAPSKGLAPPPRRPGAAPSPAAKRPGAASVAAAPKRSVVAPPRRGAGSAAVAQAQPQAQDKAEKVDKPIPAPSEPKLEPPLRKSVPPPARKSIAKEKEPAPAPVPPPPATDFEDDAPTRIHDGTSLAAAFSMSLDSGSVSAAGPAAVPEEWYIGIDGSPVGPLTYAQLREKASSGAATHESLVWREGFEEWKPLKEFPELLTLVDEAKAAPLPAPAVLPSPPAAVINAGAAVAAGPTPEIVFPKSEPEKADKEGSKATRREHSIMERFSLRPLRPGLSHRMAWAGLIVALGLGVTIGIVLFSKTEQKEVVKYVEVPASAKPEDSHKDEPQTLEEATVLADPAGKKAGSGSSKVEPAPVATNPSGKGGLAGLSGLNGLNGLGPTGTGPDVTQTAAPGGQLDGAAISRVVSNFTPSVRRGCWDPAILSRAPDAPSTARVSVAITIAPSGNVDNVTTSGDPKGYPNLAHCIESKVRGWKFPRSGGSTTANVPFVFASQ